VRGYLATMQLGARGEWKFHILYTPEEHEGGYIYLFYLALGRAAEVLDVGMPTVYHMARLLAAACLLAAMYHFVCTFVARPTSRIRAYLLACAGGGVGWLTVLLSSGNVKSPAGLGFADLYILPTVTLFPHGCLAVAMMVAIFVLCRRYFGEGKPVQLGLAVALSLLLSMIQPICAALAAAVTAVHCLLLWGMGKRFPPREFAMAACLAIAALPAAAYDLWIIANDEVFGAWQAQNLTPSPSPATWLIGLGVMLPLAVLGMRRIDQDKVLLIAWPLTIALLVYMPHLPQRRFAQGITVPLGCLAALGLDRLYGTQGTTRRKTATLYLLLGAAVLSSVTFFAVQTQACLSRTRSVFHPSTELAAINWLAKNTSWSETVLAGPHAGTYIPAAIGHRVYWAHWCETIDLDKKTMEFIRFFDGETGHEWRRGFLERYGIRYVLYEPQRRGWGDFEPAEASYLTKRYQAGDYTVFEVVQATEQ